MIRILIIEDDNNRVTKIQSWLPDDVRLVHAVSAGRVLGILKRDSNQYAGIMLDHDLQTQVATATDMELSGTTVVTWIKDMVPTDVPILIHSMNFSRAPEMKRSLEVAGFSVTRIAMDMLEKEHFHSWLNEVRDNWDDRE